MARLHAYGGDNGTKALSEFDTVDLQALQLAREWGVNGKKEARWTYSPCPRPGCGVGRACHPVYSKSRIKGNYFRPSAN